MIWPFNRKKKEIAGQPQAVAEKRLESAIELEERQRSLRFRRELELLSTAGTRHTPRTINTDKKLARAIADDYNDRARRRADDSSDLITGLALGYAASELFSGSSSDSSSSFGSSSSNSDYSGGGGDFSGGGASGEW